MVRSTLRRGGRVLWLHKQQGGQVGGNKSVQVRDGKESARLNHWHGVERKGQIQKIVSRINRT